MGQAVIRNGIDAWVGAGAPNVAHPTTPMLRVDAGQRAAFIHFKNPVPRGATVTRATLRLTVYDKEGNDQRVVRVRRVTQKWVARKTTWNRQPNYASTNLAGVTVPGNAKRGHVVEFDVTDWMQAVANGQANYGFRLHTNISKQIRFYGFKRGRYAPALDVEWSDAPDAPTTLSPSEGAVSISHPTLQFDYTDVSGSTELAAVQVQIDPSEDPPTTPAFDSGEVVTTEPELDLSTTAFAGVAHGETLYWRVRVKDGDGLWSEWSDWVILTRIDKGVVTITNPPDVAEPYVEEPTPPIAWTFSGTQVAWAVNVREADNPSSIIFNTGKEQGADTVYTLPKGVLRDDRSYVVQVRVWDDEDRERTPGDPVYAATHRTFVMTDDANTPGAETLTATAEPDRPWVTLTWTRPTMPDGFAIYRDGTVVEKFDEPIDAFVSGTTYQWRDYSAAPYEQHVYSVRAIINGKQSPPGQTATIATTPRGVWLADIERDLIVVLAGDDGGSWEMPDEASTYLPLGASEVVRVVGGLGGYSGSLSGELIDGFYGKSVAEQEADLWEIKGSPVSPLRLVAGDVNIPVVLGNITVAPTPISREGQIVKHVSFDFWQVGELPFTPRL